MEDAEANLAVDFVIVFILIARKFILFSSFHVPGSQSAVSAGVLLISFVVSRAKMVKIKS